MGKNTDVLSITMAWYSSNDTLFSNVVVLSNSAWEWSEGSVGCSLKVIVKAMLWLSYCDF